MHSRFRVTNSSDRLGLDLGLPQVMYLLIEVIYFVLGLDHEMYLVKLTIQGGFQGLCAAKVVQSCIVIPGVQSACCSTGEPRRKVIAGEKRTGRAKVRIFLIIP